MTSRLTTVFLFLFSASLLAWPMIEDPDAGTDRATSRATIENVQANRSRSSDPNAAQNQTPIILSRAAEGTDVTATDTTESENPSNNDMSNIKPNTSSDPMISSSSRASETGAPEKLVGTSPSGQSLQQVSVSSASIITAAVEHSAAHFAHPTAAAEPKIADVAAESLGLNLSNMDEMPFVNKATIEAWVIANAQGDTAKKDENFNTVLEATVSALSVWSPSISKEKLGNESLKNSLLAKLEFRAQQARGEVLSAAALLQQRASKRTRQEKIAELIRFQQTYPLSLAEWSSYFALGHKKHIFLELHWRCRDAIHALNRISNRPETAEEDQLFQNAAERYEAAVRQYTDDLHVIHSLDPNKLLTNGFTTDINISDNLFENRACEHIGFLIQHVKSLPQCAEADNYRALVNLQKEHLELRQEAKRKFSTYGINFNKTIYNRYQYAAPNDNEIDSIDSFKEAFEEYTALNKSLRCAIEALDYADDACRLTSPTIRITKQLQGNISFVDAISLKQRPKISVDILQQAIVGDPAQDNLTYLLIAAAHYAIAARKYQAARMHATNGNGYPRRTPVHDYIDRISVDFEQIEFFTQDVQADLAAAEAAENKVDYSGSGLK